MQITAKDLVEKYSLLPHPEGGFYKETYRSSGIIPQSALSKVFKGNRSYATAIYFLLEKGNFSAFHRIQSDECWHFYAGDTLHVHIIHPDSKYELIALGSRGEDHFQAIVPAGSWFASETTGTFSFVGCTVAPGFDFNDFELAKGDELAKLLPDYEILIKRLCR